MGRALQAILVTLLIIAALPFVYHFYEERNVVVMSRMFAAQLYTKILSDALQAYYTQNRKFPVALDELQLNAAHTVPSDPWGNPYWYEVQPDLQSFKLQSLGRDGKAGGRGECTDVQPTTDLASVEREIDDGLCDT